MLIAGTVRIIELASSKSLNYLFNDYIHNIKDIV